MHNIDIGYLKDVLGAGGFLVAMILLFFIKDLNKYRKVLFFTLIICFMVDFVFTLDKDYHCMGVGDNIPTKCVIISGFSMALLIIFVILDKKFKLF